MRNLNVVGRADCLCHYHECKIIRIAAADKTLSDRGNHISSKTATCTYTVVVLIDLIVIQQILERAAGHVVCFSSSHIYSVVLFFVQACSFV